MIYIIRVGTCISRYGSFLKNELFMRRYSDRLLVTDEAIASALDLRVLLVITVYKLFGFSASLSNPCIFFKGQASF